MPDIGHVAVGLYAARLKEGERPLLKDVLRAGLFWSALALLPDSDILFWALGAPDTSALGHRGAFHSLVFAVFAAGIVWLYRRKDGWAAFFVVASHGALDMLDTGRLGVAYLWPLSGKRLFWPDAMRFLPGPPPGQHWLTLAGARVIALGALPFLPLFFLALRGCRDAGVAAASELRPDPS